MEALYEYSKKENRSLEKMYEDILDQVLNLPLSSFDAKGYFENILKEYALDTEITQQIDVDDPEIKVVTKILGLLKSDARAIDWSSENVGSFISKSFGLKSVSVESELADMFTLPKNNVSLIDVVKMYNLFDFKILRSRKLYTPARFNETQPTQPECDYSDLFSDCSANSNQPVLTRYSAFDDCFKNVAEDYELLNGQTIMLERDIYKIIRPSACENLTGFSNCIEYCSWHKKFFRDIDYGEFLALMSLSNAQRKILDYGSSLQKQIAG